MRGMANLLIIEDDPGICSFLLIFADSWGHTARQANTIAEGLAYVRKTRFDIVLLDLELPDGNGLHILPELMQGPAHPEVIIITGTGDIHGARLAFKYGAWDFVTKPFTMEEIALPVSRALAYRTEKAATEKPPLTLKRGPIIGSSVEIAACLEDVARAAVSNASVLITGETGTGKELFARAIHDNSQRHTADYVPVDCGAIPESLVEGIFFGYEKGAFTGAVNRQIGVMAQARGGTLFLDEIGDLSPNSQKALLRALQERCIRPLGASHEITLDFRVVAATNRDLDRMVAENRFRKDLLYRIRAFEIKLPPLRDRKTDIEEIAVHKIHSLCRQYGMGMKGMAPDFLKQLNENPWPGNVRELINVLEYALAAAGTDPTIHPKHLPPEYRAASLDFKPLAVASNTPRITDRPPGRFPFPTLQDHRLHSEQAYLHKLIQVAKGDRNVAVRLAGVSQSSLYSLLKKHHLSLTDEPDY